MKLGSELVTKMVIAAVVKWLSSFECRSASREISFEI